MMLNDEWLTPPEIVRALGPFDLDPCAPIVRPWPTAAKHYTVDDDGLSLPWFGRVWLNPPYGPHTGTWLERLREHGDGIALIFARTETEAWFRHIWGIADGILFLRGRLNFHFVSGKRAERNSGAPSALIAYGEENVDPETLSHRRFLGRAGGGGGVCAFHGSIGSECSRALTGAEQRITRTAARTMNARDAFRAAWNRAALKEAHSRETQDSYWGWTKRLFVFTGRRGSHTWTGRDWEAFEWHLLSHSSRHVARNAMNFVFNKVLRLNLGRLDLPYVPKPQPALVVVPTREELGRIFTNLRGQVRLAPASARQP